MEQRASSSHGPGSMAGMGKDTAKGGRGAAEQLRGCLCLCTTTTREIQTISGLLLKSTDFSPMWVKEKAGSCAVLPISTVIWAEEDEKEMPVTFSPSVLHLAAHLGGSDAISCENT